MFYEARTDEMKKKTFEIQYATDQMEFTGFLRNTPCDFLFSNCGMPLRLNNGDIFLSYLNYASHDYEADMKIIHAETRIIEEKTKNFLNGIPLKDGMKLMDNAHFSQFIELMNRRGILDNFECLFDYLQDLYYDDENTVNKITMAVETSMAGNGKFDKEILLSALKEDTGSYYIFSNLSIRYDYVHGHTYLFEEPADVLYYDLDKLLQSGSTIKKCENCGKYFVPISRSDEKYCYYRDLSGKSCREVGYGNKVNSDEILKTYRKVYKTQNARKQRNKNNCKDIESRFKSWSNFAKTELERCKQGEIDLKTFERNIDKTDWLRGE